VTEADFDGKPSRTPFWKPIFQPPSLEAFRAQRRHGLVGQHTIGGDRVRWSEPIETAAPAPAVGETDPWAGWQRWLQSHLDIERDLTVEVVGETLAAVRREIAEAIEKSIAPLAREISELTGAMNVMRSLGHAGLRLRGAFDAAGEYLAHDVVGHNGSSFVALRDRPGRCPGEGWQLLASKGNRGERGGPGPRGMTGGRGEPAPLVKAWLIDKAKFTASPILTDGTVGAPLELKSLFQEFLDQTRAGA
jgi:hypothetical protein